MWAIYLFVGTDLGAAIPKRSWLEDLRDGRKPAPRLLTTAATKHNPGMSRCHTRHLAGAVALRSLSGCGPRTARAMSMPAVCLALASGGVLSACGAARHNAAEALPVAGFAVFDASPTANDALPAEVAASLRDSLAPEFSSADIRAARRVLALEPGWLVPVSNGEICLVRSVYPLATGGHSKPLPPTIQHSCASDAAAREGRLVATQSLATSLGGSPSARVVGVIPTGVASVTIVSRSGQSTTVAVDRNAYETVIREPATIRFVTVGHARRIKREIPIVTVSRHLSP